MRRLELYPSSRCIKMTVAIGADIARFGSDMTAIVTVVDTRVMGLDEWSGRDLMDTTGRIMKTIEAHDGDVVLAVDDTGLGGGVVDRLTELGVNLLPINYGARAYDSDRFANKAAEMGWRLRELHDPEGVEPIRYSPSHPLLDRLMAQISGVRYKFTSAGKIQVVKMSDGEDSPGLYDALCLAYEAWVTFWSGHSVSERSVRNEAVFGHLLEEVNHAS